jgi:hypothetical protein
MSARLVCTRGSSLNFHQPSISANSENLSGVSFRLGWLVGWLVVGLFVFFFYGLKITTT